jgi:uncharacterized membrane protein
MSDVREASLEPRSARLAGGLLGQLAPFVFLGLGALYLHRRLGDLPARIPVHWDAAGNPNRFIPREQALMPFAAGACFCAVVLILAIALHRMAPRSELLRRSLLMLLVVEYELALLFAAVPLAALDPQPDGRMPRLLTWAVVLVLAGVLAIGFVFVRGGKSVPERNPAGYRGLFYADRNDPALFVPKKSGLGYTVNFGHPLAWPALFVLLLLPLAAALLALSAR